MNRLLGLSLLFLGFSLGLTGYGVAVAPDPAWALFTAIGGFASGCFLVMAAWALERWMDQEDQGGK